MASFTNFFDSDLGWQGWHGLILGLHVVGFDHVWWMMGCTPIQACMASFSVFFRFWPGLARLSQFVLGLHVVGVSLV
jgi:hypothetical protein